MCTSAALLLAAAAGGALAQPASPPASQPASQPVSLAGRMGSKAVLVIDGQPHTLGLGETVRGVTVLGLLPDAVQLRQGNASFTLRVGAAPVALRGTAAGMADAAAPAGAASGTGGSAASGATHILLPVGSGGHFVASGSINARPVRFMVDTGATHIALSRGDAERAGVDWARGEPIQTQTANGPAAAHLVTLSRVRVADVELSNLRAVVVAQAMPYVLLGNSFLSRFSMRREADVMRLDLRPL